MNIKYLSNSLVPSTKANSVQVMKMCHALALNGAEVKLYARETDFNVGSVYNYYGVENNFYIEWQKWPNIKGLGWFIYSKRVYKKLLKEKKADLVYGRDLYSIEKISRRGWPVALEAHTLPSNFYSIYRIKKLTKRTNFKKLIVTSNALKEQYLKLLPWLSSIQIQVVRNGADIPKSLKQNLANKRISNPIKIGYIGHLYPGKGMEIIGELAKYMPTHEFHIVGGTNDDIEFWKKKLTINNVIFHGFVPNNQLENYYNEFDIMIAPYQDVKLNNDSGSIDKWASPLKIIEYMSYKKPIIASDLPMIKEVITDEKNGLLCAVNNLNEWIDKINEISMNDDLREKIAENAFKDFIQQYTWKQRGKKVINECLD